MLKNGFGQNLLKPATYRIDLGEKEFKINIHTPKLIAESATLNVGQDQAS